MRILLHGAINGANFGDCLFADIFYNCLKKRFPEAQIDFFEGKLFGIGKFLQEKLNYKKQKKQNINDYDALVYISGGYFGEDSKSLKASIIRVIRYFILGLRMLNLNKKIYIVGVEVGPLHYRFMQNIAKRILGYSSLLIVRNQESQEYCLKMGINKAILSCDTAFLLRTNKDMLPPGNFHKDNGGKKIFIHLLPGDNLNSDLKDKIICPVMEFISQNHEYDVILSVDQTSNETYNEFIDLFLEHEIACTVHKYDDYWQLCNLISICDLLITRKLHVGIVGCALEKSVISTPIHEYKTKRLYSYLNETGRCIPYKDLTATKMKKLIDCYYNKPVIINSDIPRKAFNNLELLCDYIQKDLCHE